MKPVQPGMFLLTTLTASVMAASNNIADSLAARPILITLVLLLTVFIAYRLILIARRSSFANIPGPAPNDLLTGNLRSIFNGEPSEWHLNQVNTYGSIYRIRGFGGSDQLFIADPETLRHVLSKKCYNYTKTKQLGSFQGIFGKGILFAEGATHARQRRIMQSAFVQKAVDSYRGVFEQEAEKLCNKLSEQCEASEKESSAIVDMLDWVSRTTLDIIGLAGFDYPLNTLNESDNALVKAMDLLTAPTASIVIMQLLGHYIPILQRLPFKSVKVVRECRDTLYGEGKKIIDRRKQLAKEGNLDDKGDLMSLLYKANTETENERDMMSDDELAGQVATFLLAGNETSSTSLSWIMARLTEFPEVQTRLREEITAAMALAESDGQVELSIEQLNEMHYSEGVIRETLRLAKALSRTVRIAETDDVLPLSVPIIGVNGQTVSEVPIKKGEQVLVGISSFNRSEEIYGEDAWEFRPERWVDDKELMGKVQQHKSYAVWAPQLSFLGGPRGCPGIRFAVLEMKVILVKLLSNFEIQARDDKIRFRPNMVARPTVIGEDKRGPQLPVKLVKLRKSL